MTAAHIPGTFKRAGRNTNQQPLIKARMAEITTSDDDLLRRSATGDEEAFVALYRRRQAGVYRFALHMCGNPTVAEEVTQEVFLCVIREGGRFDSGRGSAMSYLFGVARNQVLKHLERDRQYTSIEAESDSKPDLACDAPGPLADLTRAETIEAVRQAVLALPEAYREAVVMCDLEEMSYVDAAAALSVPIGTVRSRLSRGRSLLLDKLKSSAARSAGGFGAMRCLA
jgi:RNA polymerase sigma-70 factor, ECF subfamily